MLAILLFVCLWQSVPGKHDPVTDVQQGRSGNKEHATPQVGTVDDCAPRKVEGNQTQSNYYDPAPQRITTEEITAVATIAYTLVTMGMLIAIFRQNRSIQNAERAVLVPQWDNMVHINPEHKNGDPLSHCFQWTFANWGKGPAFIDETFAEMALIDNMESLPIRPKFGEPKHFMGDPVPPGKAFEPGFYAPMKDARKFEIVKAEYRTGGKILYVHGFVRYRDMFGRQHETRFGLRYRAGPELRHEYDCFLMDGPNAYNYYK